MKDDVGFLRLAENQKAVGSLIALPACHECLEGTLARPASRFVATWSRGTGD
jgi:hypothetical protein